MQESIYYAVALQLVAGIGNANGKQLISYIGSPEEIFCSSKKDLLRVPGIPYKTVEAIVSKSTFNKAEGIIQTALKKDIRVLHYLDDLYPDKLKTIQDAPNILYFKGDGDLNPRRSVSVVGTRNCTEYGKDIIKRLLHPLKSIKPTIFSGLAYGIDICAHKEAISTEIPTIGVLAGGLDKIYPGIHLPVVEKMLMTGGILSEHPPGTIPEAHQFPARNRIIAGISDATIVVEAAKKGGALITAEIAYSYNKPVFAVPGDIGKPYSEGCNSLIASQKALIITSENDLYTQLNWDLDSNLEKIRTEQYANLTKEEDQVIRTLNQHNGTLAIDELAWKSQLNITRLASILLQLEFKGLVKSLPGKNYAIE